MEYLGEGNFLVPMKKESEQDIYLNVVRFDPTEYWDIISDEYMTKLSKVIKRSGSEIIPAL